MIQVCQASNMYIFHNVNKINCNIFLEEQCAEVGQNSEAAERKGYLSSTKARRCDDNCIFPTRWATKVHRKINSFDPDQHDILEIQRNVMMFEHCDRCLSSFGKGCDVNSCTDGLRILRAVQPHSPRIRSLIRRIYAVRRINNWLLRVDECLNIGDYNDLRRLIHKELDEENKQQKIGDTEVEGNGIDEKEIVASKIGVNGNDFEKAISDHILTACSVCGICRKLDNLRKFKDRRTLISRIESASAGQKINENQAKELLKTWEEKHKINIRYPGWICLNFCLADLKSGRKPRMHESNGLWVDKIPDELSVLTDTELMLIQLVKCFLTLIKLKPLSKHRGPDDSVAGYRGINVHIPLPLVSIEKNYLRFKIYFSFFRLRHIVTFRKHCLANRIYTTWWISCLLKQQRKYGDG